VPHERGILAALRSWLDCPSASGPLKGEMPTDEDCRMAKYRLSYGGTWHGTYSIQEVAERAAEFEAEQRDEIVFVIKTSLLGNRFVTAFPLEYRDYARRGWKAMGKGASWEEIVTWIESKGRR
jgi:hypothetical protein